MRTLLIVSLFLLAFGVSAAVAPQQGRSSGEVGDLRYSFLDERRFQAVHGAEWVLCDGKTELPQAFKDLTGLERLPDARGVFLRAMNYGPGDSNRGRDPFPSEHGRDRKVGEFQDDQLLRHGHLVERALGKHDPTARAHGWAVMKGPHTDDPRWSADQTGGKETRPKNIAAYLYVKIR